MVVEENVRALDISVLKDGLEPNGVWLQLFRLIQIIVSFVAVFMPPPLVEFTSVKSEVKVFRSGTYDILADGILELWFIDKCGNGAGLQERWKYIGPGTMT